MSIVVTPRMWNMTRVAFENGRRRAVVSFAEPLDGVTITYEREDGSWPEESADAIVRSAWTEVLASGVAEAFGFELPAAPSEEH